MYNTTVQLNTRIAKEYRNKKYLPAIY